jgi:Secretion system C-terminal sorting domain
MFFLQLCIVKNNFLFINKNRLSKTMTKIILKTVVLLLLSFSVASAQTNPKAEFRLSSDKNIADANEVVSVKLSVKNFSQMLGFQWAVQWDSNDYEFVSADLKNLLPLSASDVTTNLFKPGVLLFSWSFVSKAETLADGTVIYDLKFKSKKSGNVDKICFTTDALGIEVLKDSPSGAIIPVQADFIGLGCGFVWTKTAQGKKSISALTITSEKDLVLTESKVYPNPFSEQINLMFDAQNSENVQITIFDAQGKIVLTQTSTAENVITIRTEQLATGQYFYKMKNNNKVSTGKILKVE